ncbi:hypothetical protein T11_3703 [Trichinella zimbabwensis]|uniref:Uncharacterized protein n=1 Tax=Trichinella zimbabwensis TaxID=268475 RepID=A0A0V1FPH4_9BILA|nr:hypothetical protein T11_3703 [Trichinella zimbabwensis]
MDDLFCISRNSQTLLFALSNSADFEIIYFSILW